MTTRSNRHWLPPYCQPERFLPTVQKMRVLFRHPPFFFPDFLGRALAFLQGREARAMGFHYDPERVLPCTWKCSDESLFRVDLALYAYTGLYPFDKGAIGGTFNEGSLPAAVHHGSVHLDFGGSHLGYVPGNGGGTFGRIWRPQAGHSSADCGSLSGRIEPFLSVYEDACENILLLRPEGERPMVSIPNEFIQPNWSSHRVKLIVDLDTLTTGEVPYAENNPYTHPTVGRTLAYLHPAFLEALPPADAPEFQGGPVPIGWRLWPGYFNIYDAETELDRVGLPRQRLLLYMKHIVAAKLGPPILKACVVNASLEHNKLTDAVRDKAYAPYSFASFTGVFIDIFNEGSGNYLNLFQPLGMTIKPSGKTREVELPPEEIHERFARIRPAEPAIPLANVLGAGVPRSPEDLFTYKPGFFEERGKEA